MRREAAVSLGLAVPVPVCRVDGPSDAALFQYHLGTLDSCRGLWVSGSLELPPCRCRRWGRSTSQSPVDRGQGPSFRSTRSNVAIIIPGSTFFYPNIYVIGQVKHFTQEIILRVPG